MKTSDITPFELKKNKTKDLSTTARKRMNHLFTFSAYKVVEPVKSTFFCQGGWVGIAEAVAMAIGGMVA